jgi:hypothetical protein
MGLERINNNQLPVVNSEKLHFKQLPIGAVDSIADSLVTEYSNPEYRRWYCGVIYEFGPGVVEQWRCRAGEGREPAKLFSKYVRDARTFKQRGGTVS